MRILFKLLPFLLLAFSLTVVGQTKRKAKVPASNKVKPTVFRLGERDIRVEGREINSLDWGREKLESRTRTFLFENRTRKELVISNVDLDMVDGKWITSKIERITILLADLNREKSYNLEMENDFATAGKYVRVTLLARGNAMAELLFDRRTEFQIAEDTINDKVAFVTINVTDPQRAEEMLSMFKKM